MSLAASRDEAAEVSRNANGDPELNTELRDHENVPLSTTLVHRARAESKNLIEKRAARVGAATCAALTADVAGLGSPED
jgi:hypothetical protein